MRDFKIRKIENEFARFIVEIEFLDNGDREQFGYPIGDGWEELFDGKPRFLTDIAKIIDRREENTVSFSLSKVKKFEGLKVSEKDLKKKSKK